MITIFENRYVSVKNIYGTQNENNVTELEIQVPEQYKNWNKRIVFVTDEGNKWDLINGNIYKLKNNITKYQEVYCYIWLTKNSESEEESIDDFRSETFRLFFNKNVQADDTVPTEEQIDGFNTLINELNVELDKVNNINSDVEKLKEEVTQTIENLNIKVENGEFDGATFIPNVDAEGNISWTNDKGLQNPATQNIKGEKGDPGKQGEQGIPGEKGEKPVKGVDYFTDEDKQEIVDEVTLDATNKFNQNVATKTNEFNNNATAKTNTFNTNAETKTTQFNENANTKTEEFNTNAQNKIDEFNQNTEVFENRLTSLETNDTKQDELIAKLKNNQFNLVKEGTSISVKDASDLPSVLEVSGGVRQETREGYNLFDYITKMYSSSNGLTIEKDTKSGYITVNGTPTLSYVQLMSGINLDNILEDGKTYTLWQERYADGTTTGVYAQVVEKSTDGDRNITAQNSKQTFTVDKTKSYVISLQTGTIGGAGTFNNYKNRYMLYKGTEEKPYEQYGASPSPDYRSEVEVVEGNLEITKYNANYVNIKNIQSNDNVKVVGNDGGKLELQGVNNYYTGIVSKYELKPNISYSARAKVVLAENNAQGGIFIYNSNYNGLGNLGSDNRINKISLNMNEIGELKLNFTVPDDGIIYFVLQCNQTTNSGNIAYEEICLTEGTENAYTPHESKVYNLPIQQPLLSGDTFVKEDGNWFEVHTKGKYVFTGNESWEEFGDNMYLYIENFILSKGENNYIPTNYICNYFMPNSLTNAIANPNKNYMIQNVWGIRERQKGIAFRKSDLFANIDALKQFFKEKYATENPVYIWYMLATPTKLPCTPEQTQVLEQLYNSNTYRPVTNIFTQEDLANLKLSYVADSKIYVDNKFNTLAEQLLNSIGGNN